MTKFVGGAPLNVGDAIKLTHYIKDLPRSKRECYGFSQLPNGEVFALYNNKKKLDIHLSERELDILKLVVEGKSNTEIGDIIMISPHTAKSHVCKILTKLSVSDRVQAAVKAVKYDLLK